jgi:hypothetical protein
LVVGVKLAVTAIALLVVMLSGLELLFTLPVKLVNW